LFFLERELFLSFILIASYTQAVKEINPRIKPIVKTNVEKKIL